ncbi:N-acetyltransferase [Paenibacillus filicis]|uniref:N-acetyltransferase n=1 Tax=Paenibacillus gyeongsangnamensis TaxID=3388067 RepID=A0ABT4Q623_9BACL|nr:N-acetyltransferase [Paenibacillus filicis]MCZ8512140.1 N-acetyltransferase [Paenibacillus filicis]
MSMLIRTEQSSDHEEVYRLNYMAFGNRENESRLIEKIRSSEGFIPELSLVAIEGDQLVGHALFSKAKLVGEETTREVIVLAPIAVAPGCQRRGIGSALIREGLGRCKAWGAELVFLIGHPEYYPKFGFQAARRLGFDLKQFQVPDEVFLVCQLEEGQTPMRGELRYPDSFFG